LEISVKQEVLDLRFLCMDSTPSYDSFTNTIIFLVAFKLHPYCVGPNEGLHFINLNIKICQTLAKLLISTQARLYFFCCFYNSCGKKVRLSINWQHELIISIKYDLIETIIIIKLIRLKWPIFNLRLLDTGKYRHRIMELVDRIY